MTNVRYDGDLLKYFFLKIRNSKCEKSDLFIKSVLFIIINSPLASFEAIAIA